MPEPCKRTWLTVREYLINDVKLPAKFIDQAHEDSLLFSDQRFNCVFPRDNQSGVFKVGISDKPFNQTLGKNGAPFVIPGSDNKVYITDSPLEALSLKLLRPDSTIIATGEFMPADKLKPYLSQKEILLAQSQDQIGNAMAQYLREHFPQAKRIQPNQGNSWNECRLLQIEDEKKKRAQAVAQTQSATLTATTGINRPTGWSR